MAIPPLPSAFRPSRFPPLPPTQTMSTTAATSSILTSGVSQSSVVISTTNLVASTSTSPRPKAPRTTSLSSSSPTARTTSASLANGAAVPPTSSTTTLFVTVSEASSPSSSVILQSDNSQSSQGGLKTPQIIAIAVSAGVVVLTLLATLIYFIIRRRRQRRFPPSKGPRLDDNFIEKYADESQRVAYLGYQQVSAESKGTAPLINTRVAHSPDQSPSDQERHNFGDMPPSPFVNGEDYVSQAPITHAVSLANATPFAQPEDESHLDSAILVPSSPLTPSRSKASPTSVPPILIPAYVPPPRRNTRIRRSVRHSKQPYNALEGGEYSDDDSVSMYSQASASIATVHSAAMELSASTIRAFPLSGAPLAKPAHDEALNPPQPTYTATVTPAMPPSAAVPRQGEDEEDAARLSRENTLLVASLLKSRMMNVKQPERSSSLVSHIERVGSIKPALLTVDEDESVTPGGRLTARAVRKSRAAASAPPTASAQDLARAS